MAVKMHLQSPHTRVKSGLVQTGKRPITNRKRTYYRQKRDLSQTEKSPICPQKGPSIDKEETVQTKGDVLALKKTCPHSKRHARTQKETCYK